MRIVRFAATRKVRYGILQDDVIRGCQSSPFAHFKGCGTSSFPLDRSSYKLSDVRLLAPCRPSKIVALGLNFHSHAKETNLPIPSVPLFFLKPSTAVIGPDDKIVLPSPPRRVDYEGELGAAIGRRTKGVSREKAKECVLGYTCVNDVSERYAQKQDGQWTRAKSFDTFAPIGPWIETEIDPGNLKLETYLNSELRQSAYTSDFIFGVTEVISFVSNVMTLLPGDIVAMGTPSGIGRMNPGDVVEVRIGGIGTLRNLVVSSN